jgi:O-antigen/teichoic acid export membrane protein
VADFDLISGAEPAGAAAPGARTKGLGRVLAVGFGAHFLIALVNVLATPFLLKLMGAEAYGLVAFFLVLQAWMLLFDLGVSPAVARQLSRFRAGALGAEDAAAIFAAAEVAFIATGLTAGAVLIAAAPWIGGHWLHRAALTPHELDLSLRLIATTLVFRWLAGLYQSALVGLERQNLANGVAATSVVLRYSASVAALVFIARTPVAFFAVQAGFTLAEAAVSRWLLAGALPGRPRGARPGWRLLTGEFRFALGLTLASAAATLTSQADRLALSHALPLADFGLFGLVVQVCAGITLVAPPFVQAFQPRLTALLAQGQRADFVHVYRLAGGLILALAAGLAGTIAARPVWVIWAWTGRADAAAHLAPILTLYAAGGAIAAFLYVPFLLQYALGRVRLHVIGVAGFAVVWAPAAVWAAFAYGPFGTGVVWLTGNLLYLLIWVPVIHTRLLAPEERRGLDLGVWLRGALLAALLTGIHFAPIGPLSRPVALLGLAAISVAVTLIGAALSPEAREFAVHALDRLRARRR